jgi:hypothetical protein
MTTKLELFEYRLNNYQKDIIILDQTNNYYKEYKTISIEASNSKILDECGMIDVKNPSKKNIEEIRSCDYIKGEIELLNDNENPNLNFVSKDLDFALSFENIKITSEDLVKFINQNGAKKVDPTTIQKNTSTNMEDLYQFSKINKILTHTIDLFDYERPDETTIHTNYTHVLFLNPSPYQKIILFGDIHGSLSTIIRQLLRLRKLDIINQYGIISPEHIIIFLGDICDRGVYSYEIYMILYILKINNPKNLYMNRGNHEEESMTSSQTNLLINQHNHKIYHFKDEIFSKFNDSHLALDIFKKFTKIMSFQSSAIIVVNPLNNEKIFLAHGGLPYDLNNKNNLPPEFIQGVTSGKSFALNDIYGHCMRWADIYGGAATLNNINRSLDPSNPDPLYQKIGQYIINEALKLGINFIIRGHQDLSATTKVLMNGFNEWIPLNDFQDLYHDDFKLDITCKGATYDIIIKNNTLIINDKPPMKKTKFGVIPKLLPVITISTNTDTGRNISADGYATLSFIETYTYQKNCSGGSKKYQRKYHKYMSKIILL